MQNVSSRVPKAEVTTQRLRKGGDLTKSSSAACDNCCSAFWRVDASVDVLLNDGDLLMTKPATLRALTWRERALQHLVHIHPPKENPKLSTYGKRV